MAVAAGRLAGGGGGRARLGRFAGAAQARQGVKAATLWRVVSAPAPSGMTSLPGHRLPIAGTAIATHYHLAARCAIGVGSRAFGAYAGTSARGLATSSSRGNDGDQVDPDANDDDKTRDSKRKSPALATMSDLADDQAGGRVISLARPPARSILTATNPQDARETTLYVKGFLSQSESPTRFDGWLAGHRALVTTHGWGRRAAGYYWDSGSLVNVSDVPIPLATIVSSLFWAYRALRVTSVAALPALAATTAGEMAVLIGQLVYQYRSALANATLEAEHLAATLAAKRERFETVRVVAHSLGCFHLLHAVALLAPQDRPDVIHLLAPAVVESEVAETLASSPARHMTCIYHTPNDMVLSTVFRLAAFNDVAIGSVGLAGVYPKVTDRDVTEFFPLWVHTEYKNRFAELIAQVRRSVLVGKREGRFDATTETEPQTANKN